MRKTSEQTSDSSSRTLSVYHRIRANGAELNFRKRVHSVEFLAGLCKLSTCVVFTLTRKPNIGLLVSTSVLRCLSLLYFFSLYDYSMSLLPSLCSSFTPSAYLSFFSFLPVFLFPSLSWALHDVRINFSGYAT